MNEYTKRMYFCSGCRTVRGSKEQCYCPNCGKLMLPSQYYADQWIDMSADERDQAIGKWLSYTEAERNTELEKQRVQRQEDVKVLLETHSQEMNTSTWVKLLRGVATVIMIAGILASLLGGTALMGNDHFLLGVIVIALGSLISLFSVAGMMVFLDMASDLTAVRQLLSQKK